MVTAGLGLWGPRSFETPPQPQKQHFTLCKVRVLYLKVNYYDKLQGTPAWVPLFPHFVNEETTVQKDEISGLRTQHLVLKGQGVQFVLCNSRVKHLTIGGCLFALHRAACLCIFALCTYIC